MGQAVLELLYLKLIKYDKAGGEEILTCPELRVTPSAKTTEHNFCLDSFPRLGLGFLCHRDRCSIRSLLRNLPNLPDASTLQEEAVKVR
jgi:hypothetical protein